MKLMMKKIFKQNINKIIIIAVWLLIWQAAASLTGLELILAGPVNVFKALCTKLGEKDFYIAAGGSFSCIFLQMAQGIFKTGNSNNAVASDSIIYYCADYMVRLEKCCVIYFIYCCISDDL